MTGSPIFLLGYDLADEAASGHSSRAGWPVYKTRMSSGMVPDTATRPALATAPAQDSC